MTTADASTPTIRLDIDQAIAWLSIDNSSRLNALRASMWAQIPQLIQDAQTNPDVRVIVLRGAGNKAFSAGADISEFATARTGDAARHYNRLNHDAFEALEGCQKPTIAMIHGFCLGGGLGLAVSCDMRICDDKAQFSIPAAKLGIGYHPRWIRPILAAISTPHAKELVFTGARFDAQWAMRTGLVNSISQPNELAGYAKILAGRIGENAPLSLKAAKRSIDALTVNPASSDLGELEHLVDDCFASQDYAEGQRAFAQKRKPVFKGC